MKEVISLYLYKLNLKIGNETKIINLLNNRYIDSDGFYDICNSVMEKIKTFGDVNIEPFLKRLEWTYGFRVAEAEWENTFNLE
jgi:hypothetical protein